MSYMLEKHFNKMDLDCGKKIIHEILIPPH